MLLYKVAIGRVWGASFQKLGETLAVFSSFLTRGAFSFRKFEKFKFQSIFWKKKAKRGEFSFGAFFSREPSRISGSGPGLTRNGHNELDFGE